MMVREELSSSHFEIEVNALSVSDSLYMKAGDREKMFKRNKSYDYSKTISFSTKINADTYDRAASGNKKNNRNDTLIYPVQEKFSAGIVIDINTADTAILKKVPGIGSVISRNMVNYRNRLGGFYDVDQILEVKYADTTLLKWFDVKSGIFRKIKVNSDGIDVLRKHPYMDFYKAKAIVEYRRKRGRINTLSQLSMLKEFTENDMERLRPYFSFE